MLQLLAQDILSHETFTNVHTHTWTPWEVRWSSAANLIIAKSSNRETGRCSSLAPRQLCGLSQYIWVWPWVKALFALGSALTWLLAWWSSLLLILSSSLHHHYPKPLSSIFLLKFMFIFIIIVTIACLVSTQISSFSHKHHFHSSSSSSTLFPS